jgi:glucose-6-phosphate 1-dehydrogenase
MSLMQVKQPGLEMSTVQSELDLSYKQRYQGVAIPEAYERLILDTYDSCLLFIFFWQNIF